ncbi:hypothetical protein DPMN_101852 [Dreissena polymorpha]|uniref:Aldehyde oxidase/xanthine dehydrogenase a/b hammerhead domain-containing protein n=1 Tax=Dreissena polymorpha TaxID=45954 RepID=A0A9D4LLT3_DREPO|nr:hypothetical protein DPMN_101852 [Dreissena polymorpha]
MGGMHVLQTALVSSDELYLAFVTSSKAHARILSVDPSEALAMPGVVDYVSHKDVPGHNKWGSMFPDDEKSLLRLRSVKYKYQCLKPALYLHMKNPETLKIDKDLFYLPYICAQ